MPLINRFLWEYQLLIILISLLTSEIQHVQIQTLYPQNCSSSTLCISVKRHHHYSVAVCSLSFFCLSYVLIPSIPPSLPPSVAYTLTLLSSQRAEMAGSFQKKAALYVSFRSLPRPSVALTAFSGSCSLDTYPHLIPDRAPWGRLLRPRRLQHICQRIFALLPSSPLRSMPPQSPPGGARPTCLSGAHARRPPSGLHVARRPSDPHVRRRLSRRPSNVIPWIWTRHV